jgi:hypothetical protein
MEEFQYPIGRFIFPKSATEQNKLNWIKEIQDLPLQVKTAVESLNEKQLQLIYRPDGWTIKQLVNHLVDSHSNSIIRFKLTLTEELPTIRPYAEERWALLADTHSCPLDLSLSLLENLHKRWIILLESMQEEQWQRKMYHPESKKEFTLLEALALYAWHSKHHLAHIELAKKSEQ